MVLVEEETKDDAEMVSLQRRRRTPRVQLEDVVGLYREYELAKKINSLFMAPIVPTDQKGFALGAAPTFAPPPAPVLPPITNG